MITKLADLGVAIQAVNQIIQLISLFSRNKMSMPEATLATDTIEIIKESAWQPLVTTSADIPYIKGAQTHQRVSFTINQ